MTRLPRQAVWVLLVALFVGLPFACAPAVGSGDAATDDVTTTGDAAPVVDAPSEAAPETMTSM